VTDLDAALPVALALIRRFEGFRSKPYLCPAGVPTIGWGATRYPSGARVRLTDPAISREAGDRMLLLAVQREYLPAVLKLCPGIDSPDRLAAIIDFCFNLGSGNLAASTLRRRINVGRWADVPAELRKWVLAGGKPQRGLQLRRAAEVELV